MPGKHRAGAQRAPKRPVETSEYVAFATRVIIGLGDRIADDPESLVHVAELAATLTQHVNRGMWEANKRHGYSQNYMARILGVTRQAVAKRIGLGELAAASVTERRGGGALVRLGEVRARRARLLQLAEVPDQSAERFERLRAV